MWQEMGVMMIRNRRGYECSEENSEEKKEGGEKDGV